MAHDGAFAQFLRTYLVNAESDNESDNEGIKRRDKVHI